MDAQKAEQGTGRNRCFECCKKHQGVVDNVCRFFGEFFSTFMLLFLGCMGCVKNDTFINAHFNMTLNFGLVVMLIVQCFNVVSGSHMNPAVTIVAYIYKRVTLPMAFAYFAAQFLGACVGYGLLMTLIPKTAVNPIGAAHGLCVTVPHPQITIWQGLGIEFIATAVLAFICCGVWDPRNNKYHDSVALKFGLAVSSLAITAGPYTGCSMNPARSFAPSLWQMDFTGHWIYWVGPILGSGAGGLFYRAVFRREVKED